MRPVVGISQCVDASGRFTPGRETAYLDLAYARAVEAAGGIPVHLPLQADPRALVHQIDGLLIPGGDDFLPVLRCAYPEHVRFEPACAAQIEFDGGLISTVLERPIPFLGICYGMQLLALRCGGTLHHHLPVDLPEAQDHELRTPGGRHEIAIEANTRLADALGTAPRPVNSRHHQAVATAGDGLRACARGTDNVIEAIEGTGSTFCVGVQWHPERLPDPERDALFGCFVAACRENAALRRERA